jgi:hypothetical protein
LIHTNDAPEIVLKKGAIERLPELVSDLGIINEIKFFSKM